jgi:hypothetical protein
MTSRKLTPRQRRFVELYVRTGNATQAARDAGYTKTTAEDTSWAILRRPHVLEAVRVETQAGLDAGVAVGKRVLLDLADNAQSEAVRLQAGLALLDRGGLRLKHLSEHVHTHNVVDQRSDAELRERIVVLSRELGVPVGLLIEHERPALPPSQPIDIEDAELIEQDIFT